MDGQQLLRSTWKWQWNVERAPDGTVVVRNGAAYGLWRGLLLLGTGLFCTWMLCLFAIWTFAPASRISLYHRGGWQGIGLLIIFFLLFAAGALALLGISLWALLHREEWRASPGLLEVQYDLLGMHWFRRYTNASFVLRYGMTRGGEIWTLALQTSEASKALAAGSPERVKSGEETKLGRFVQTLAGATRFPYTDPYGQLHLWRADPVPGPASGGNTEIRHLRTGQVLVQVAGSTLAGADLAGFQLEGADLQRADLRATDLSGADLRAASLTDAKLTNAKPRKSLLTAADLSGADLTGADIAGADLTGASYDARTRWPEGFDPHQHRAVMAE